MCIKYTSSLLLFFNTFDDDISPSLAKRSTTSLRVLCSMSPKMAKEANPGSEKTGTAGTRVELVVSG